MRWLWPLFCLPACVYGVSGEVFRVKIAAGAYDRAVAAVEARCHGVRFTNPEAGIVTSKWQVYHSSEGAFLGRCQVAIVATEGELGADVRIAVTLKQCPLSDLDDLQALGDSATCPVVFAVPQEVANGQQDAVRKVQYDMRQ